MLKFALVGCGRISVRHAELLGSGKVAGATLAAVCDVVESRARETGEKFGVPHFTDMHEMMRDVDVDAVSVLTPSGLHGEHVVGLAQHGKHIVVEKPMALTLDRRGRDDPGLRRGRRSVCSWSSRTGSTSRSSRRARPSSRAASAGW